MRKISTLLLACWTCADGRRTIPSSKQAEWQVQSPQGSLARLLLATSPILASRYVHSSNANFHRPTVVTMQESTPAAEENVETGMRKEKTRTREKKIKKKSPKEKVKAPEAKLAVAMEPERIFWEGKPSATETLIPGLSVFTVVGIIPFGASLARQAWTRYSVSNRRFTVQSGFQGKDEVQFIWREVDDVKWLRRYGGAAGDLVFSLRDGSKIEVRSLPEFDRILGFIMSMIDDAVKDQLFPAYPDKPARDYLGKVEAGEAEPPYFTDSTPESAASER